MNLSLFFAIFSTQFLLSCAQWGPFLEPCRTNDYPPPSNTAPALPWFVVNLDQPPELRWQQIATQYASQIRTFSTFLKSLVPTDPLRAVAVEFVDKYFQFVLDRIAPGDLSAEIIGIAIASNISVGEIVLAQLGYDITAACTSIVTIAAAAPPATNSSENNTTTVIHARNLDFGKFLGWSAQDHTFAMTEHMRSLAINVDFQRQNRTVFQAVQFAGQIGVLTGVKPQVVSISVNTRHISDWRQSGFAGVIQWMLLQNDSSQFVGFLVRQVLEQATTFEQAEQMLAQTPLVAPVYFTIASGESTNKTGCVLTRSPSSLLNERCLNSSSATTMMMNGETDWFVLETNYDWWIAPPSYDNRRAPAMKCMEQLGGAQRQLDAGGLFNVLSTKPVRNLGTIYTSIMRPMSNSNGDNPLMESYQRECMDWDCWPF